MAEHVRIFNPHTHKIFQLIDAERCMVLDSVTGDAHGFGVDHYMIGTFEDALDYVKNSPDKRGRLVIVRMSCVVDLEVKTQE